jgi:hypothetical protein
MKNLTATLCLTITLLLGSSGVSYALPPCPAERHSIRSPWLDCSGVYIYPIGHKYEGEFKNDKRHGRGSYTHANGDKYVGEYLNGRRHGQGTETYENGDEYVGSFKDGQRNGQGIYTGANDLKYVGKFIRDLPQIQAGSDCQKITVENLNTGECESLTQSTSLQWAHYEDKKIKRPFWTLSKIRSKKYGKNLRTHNFGLKEPLTAKITIVIPDETDQVIASGTVDLDMCETGKFNSSGGEEFGLIASGKLEIQNKNYLQDKNSQLLVRNLPLTTLGYFNPNNNDGVETKNISSKKSFFSDKDTIIFLDIDGDGKNELVIHGACGERGGGFFQLYEYNKPSGVPEFTNRIETRSTSWYDFPTIKITTNSYLNCCVSIHKTYESLDGKYVLTQLTDNNDYFNTSDGDGFSNCKEKKYRRRGDGKLCLVNTTCEDENEVLSTKSIQGETCLPPPAAALKD